MVSKTFTVQECQYADGDPPEARFLSQPRCQNSAATWYLVYRWLLLAVWVFIVVCSIFEFGSFNPKEIRKLWFIYLTNWDLALGTVQSLLGAVIVTKRWRRQKVPDFNPNNLTLGKLETLFWFLYVATSTLALTVTIIYWSAVHDPRIHDFDPLNVMIHVCNSALMVTDIVVSRVPFGLKNFWWCPVTLSSYIVFSLIYYGSGGQDRLGNHYIYKILDWERPRTLLVCLGVLVFVIALHCLLHYSNLFLDTLYRKLGRKNDKMLDRFTI